LIVRSGARKFELWLRWPNPTNVFSNNLDRDISHSASDAISIGAVIAACFAVTSWFACGTGLAALGRMRLTGVSSRVTFLSIYAALAVIPTLFARMALKKRSDRNSAAPK
jgi:hypothetical protein